MNNPPQRIYRARWVLPIDSPPIENGCLIIEGDRIASVARHTSTMPVDEDFGDAMMLPGFVNAHTHLELTHLCDAVPFNGAFVEWIQQLPGKAPRAEGPDAAAASMRDGLKQSYDAGVTLIGDISTGEIAVQTWRGAPVRVCGWLEVMGITAAHRSAIEQDRTVAGVREIQRRYETPIGITPHAPYTTDAVVYREAIDLARSTGCGITTHLAETHEERQFLLDGSGPLRAMLEAFGLWDGTFVPPGCSPVRYAEQLGLLGVKPVLAHVNYPDDADLRLLAEWDCHVAYCPRSHRFFHHDPHRYREMLEAGINVCIGTDSLASNDTLSILDELRFLRDNDRTISDEQLLRMGTINGAAALGQDSKLGSLSPGKYDDFVVVPLEVAATRNPQADLLRSTTRVASTHRAVCRP